MKCVLCVIAIIYFLNLSIDSGSALICYSCQSFTGQQNPCEINVNNRTVATTPCYSGYNSCMTLIFNQTIIRACAQSHVCSFYHNATGLRRCSTCSYDYCNNSGFVPSFSTSLGIFAVLYSITKYFQ